MTRKTRKRARSERLYDNHRYTAGEPLYRSRTRKRLPRGFLRRDRLDELDGHLRSPVARRIVHEPDDFDERRESKGSWRFPAPQEIPRQSVDILKSMQMVGQKYRPFCKKRKQRKEVLFALKVAGHKGRSPGRGGGYRRTIDSNYSCRS